MYYLRVCLRTVKMYSLRNTKEKGVVGTVISISLVDIQTRKRLHRGARLKVSLRS
jgi:hypothetical protein